MLCVFRFQDIDGAGEREPEGVGHSEEAPPRCCRKGSNLHWGALWPPPGGGEAGGGGGGSIEGMEDGGAMQKNQPS